MHPFFFILTVDIIPWRVYYKSCEINHTLLIKQKWYGLTPTFILVIIIPIGVTVKTIGGKNNES